MLAFSFFKTRFFILPSRNCAANFTFLHQYEGNELLPSKPFSSSSSSSRAEQDRGLSFTLSYLINSCGLSPQTALSASKRVAFETPERPDSILAFLRSHGFIHEHIPKLIRYQPRLLLVNPEKTILPKFQFLYSLGFSRPDLVKIFYLCPNIFSRSLNNHLVPCYNILKTLVQVDEKAVCALKRCPGLIGYSWIRAFASNTALLRGLGMPQSCIVMFSTCHSSTLARNSDKFKKRAQELVEMGFDPKKHSFMSALKVFFSMTPSNLERKMKVYMRWGWSEDDIRVAFRKDPRCMIYSEKKIMNGMDFLVNKMGWPPVAIAKILFVLSCSLEKRIIPRYNVARVLQMRGFIVKNSITTTLFHISEERFLGEFVVKYQEHVPNLLKAYQGKMGLLELGLKES